MRLFSLAGVLLLATATSAQNPPLDWTRINQEALDKLAEYVRIDTTNPPGNEIATAKWFGQIFRAEGIPYEIAESEPGRGNVVARMKGTGSEPALILLAHMDVVPASRQFWTVDPFAAVVKEGYLWGRGTLDMKGLGTAELMAFLLLYRNHVPLRRDVIFLATADEEAGGVYGAAWVVKNRPAWISGAESLVTETASAYAEENGGPRQYRIILGEKAPAWMKLTSKGRAGHAAYPNPESATNRMIAALERLRTTPQPLEVTPVARQALHTQAAYEPEPWRSRFQDIDAYVKTPGAYNELLKRPAVLTQLSNTISITMLEGSNKINVVPTVATAQLDCRLLPGITIEQWIQRLRATIQDDSITVETVFHFKPNDSPADTPLSREIKTSVSRLFPQAVVVDDLQPSFTDSHWFRDLGIVSYGFPIFPVSAADRARVHGNDERISIAAYEEGVRLMWEFVFDFSKAQ
jgi:acetylornithine deacetylase/succinyl-diaminopimelate desuccinylase-like protein